LLLIEWVIRIALEGAPSSTIPAANKLGVANVRPIRSHSAHRAPGELRSEFHVGLPIMADSSTAAEHSTRLKASSTAVAIVVLFRRGSRHLLQKPAHDPTETWLLTLSRRRARTPSSGCRVAPRALAREGMTKHAGDPQRCGEEISSMRQLPFGAGNFLITLSAVRLS